MAAIVGMAARFPGAADLGGFWDLLLQKKSVYAPLPPERLDRELLTSEIHWHRRCHLKKSDLTQKEDFS